MKWIVSNSKGLNVASLGKGLCQCDQVKMKDWSLVLWENVLTKREETQTQTISLMTEAEIRGMTSRHGGMPESAGDTLSHPPLKNSKAASFNAMTL